MVQLGRNLEGLEGEERWGRGRNLHGKVELPERQTYLGRESRGRGNFTAE